MAIRRIGIVTDTHYTTQARQDAIGANRWPVWMNGLTPWHFAAVEAKAAKANTTFATQSVDAIVHLGDLYTPQGAVVDYAAVHPLFTVEGKPTLYCLGNHDVTSGSTTKEQFLAAVEQDDHYFYQDFGNVRVFILNLAARKVSGEESYVYTGDEDGESFDEGSYIPPAQLAWLDTGLAEADAAGMFSVVCGHYPWHTAPIVGNANYLKNGPDLMAVCTAHRVIACFNGHHHAPNRVTGFDNVLGNEILCVSFEGQVDDYFGEIDEVNYTKAAHAVAEIDDFTGSISIAGYNGERSYQVVTQIKDWHDLANIPTAAADDGDYELIADLTPASDGYAESGAGTNWNPRCAVAPYFTGSFNGNGHTIDGLTINSTVATRGLFSSLGAGANVHSVHFSNVNILTTNQTAGVLAGLVRAGTGLSIKHVTAKGAVTCQMYGGGLIGDVEANVTGVIEECAVDVNVTTTRNASSNNFHYAGGFVGRQQSAGLHIQNCRADGNVVANGADFDGNNAGGFTGYAVLGTITNCLSTGDVTAGGTSVAAFAGRVAATAALIACYFDTHGGTLSDVNATGLSTAELQHADIVADLITGAGWNFMNIWGKRAGHYPELLTPELWPLARALSEDTFALTVTADLMDYYDDRAAFLNALKAAVIDQWDDAFTSALQAHWDEAIWGADGLNMESPIQGLTVDLGRLASGGVGIPTLSGSGGMYG